MLIKQGDLKKIKTGEISLAFRRWKKQAVKKGSLIKSTVGQLEILQVTRINLDKLTLKDAKQAGFTGLKELKEVLNKRTEGDIYKIKLRYHSPDPRIELRNNTELSEKVWLILFNKLLKLDKFSKQGAWTLETLELIKTNPKLRALDLAKKCGREKDWLKLNIRKLKNLGLTISHEVGYTLSPLGEATLKKLKKS